MFILTRNIPRFDPGPITFNLVILIILVPIISLVILESGDRRAQRKQPRGCRKLGLRIRSNLADQLHPKYAKGGPPGEDEKGDPRWKILSLMVYPIKSCRGIELNKGDVIATGMKYDRLFTFAQVLPPKPKVASIGVKAEPALTDSQLKSPFPVSETTPEAEKAAHEWEFVTQRSRPLLAKVKIEVWIPDSASANYSPTAPEVRSGGVLVITFPWQEDGWKGRVDQMVAWLKRSVPEKSFTIPLDPTPQQIQDRGYEFEKVKVWKDFPQGLNMSVELPPALKYFLGITHPFALFRVPTDSRQVFRCAPKKEELGYQPVVSFADSFPLHLLNLASVRKFNEHVKEAIPKLNILRFRPNIIIAGPEPHAEDDWKKIRIGQDEYHVSCRTTRCKLPNVDPETGVPNKKEPDNMLRKTRNIDKGAPRVGCMGMQMVPVKEHGTIKVGDAIELLESGEHFYIGQ